VPPRQSLFFFKKGFLFFELGRQLFIVVCFVLLCFASVVLGFKPRALRM
jgi:hypothetical protein